MNDIFLDLMTGRGMLPMDLFVVGCLWFSAAVAMVVSNRLHSLETPRAGTYRWMMTLGFLILAAVLTLRLLQWGDLPMSPPYAAGLIFLCVGYCGAAIERIRAIARKP